MRFIASLILSFSLMTGFAHAQQDSIFEDYDDYASFVDQHIMARDFAPLILRLGGRDEYNSEELAATNANLRRAWPTNFENVSTFRAEDLGGGLRQEGRLFWNDSSYAFFYALLHQREDSLVVISFHLNSNSQKVLERF